MSTTRLTTPTSLLRFGIARRDITPPVGIYHRFWGAATHDVASGIHRPLLVTAAAMCPEGAIEAAAVLVAIDHCLLRPDDMQQLREHVATHTSLPDGARLLFTWSHSHSAGHICRHRADQPGGELIGPYLDTLAAATAEAVREAAESLTPARITYATTSSPMGAHRDFQDPASGDFVCGFNPDHAVDLPVQLARVRSLEGSEIATLVSYPCHPTTLAWENSLISPDYIGELRATVEEATGVPCLFLLSPCGDIGPRQGYVGDPAIADDNGRQVGHAALSAWHSLSQTEGDFEYRGPVLSGATLGDWRYRGWPQDAVSPFSLDRFTVPLPYRDDLRDPDEVLAELQRWESEASQLAEPGSGADERASRPRAMAERCRREWERLAPLPPGPEYPMEVDLWQLGDALFVFVEGEPYFQLLPDLRAAFPGSQVFVVVLSDGSRCSYLPTREACDQALYQVSVSLLAAGCLESLRDTIIARLGASG